MNITTLPDLYHRIEFRGLIEGDYPETNKNTPRLSTTSLLTRSIVSRDDSNLKGIRFGGESFKSLIGSGSDESDSIFQREFSSSLDFDSLSFGASSPPGVYSSSLAEKPGMDQIGSKSKDVKFLESFLSGVYKNYDLKITRIENLPQTRKEVKRVFFSMCDEVYQVWVFKAHPKQTARELLISQIVYDKGIPTAKPLGYNPESDKDYPYDIAVLGGIVENAGDPYDRLLENLVLSEEDMFKTAKGITKLIRKFHSKLGYSLDEFKSRGINLENSSPRKEINERIKPVLKIQDESLEELISLCERLYNRQADQRVISHGDLHTGNIVTLTKNNPKFKSHVGTSLVDFGVIDYGSMCLDYPLGDLADFWIHHARKTSSLTRNYPYDFKDVQNEYFIHDKDNKNARNGFIPLFLWNLYEMFDPTRTKQDDISSKARYHYKILVDLSNSQRENMGDFNKIIKNLDKIIPDWVKN